MNSLHNLKSVQDLKAKCESLSQIHMRQLLADKERNTQLTKTHDGIMFDFSHEKLDGEAMDLLLKLSEERHLVEKFKQMFNGEKINKTENRRVLHVALRKHESDSLIIDNVDLVKEVHSVLKNIKEFSNEIRSGNKTGFTGKKLKNIISIGIGGSYLATDFVFNAIKNNYESDYQLRFLANVCPIDFHRATAGLNVEETLIVIISKTFTTAETMLNARNCRHWLLDQYKQSKNTTKDNEKEIINKHFCAVSTNIDLTDKFGIDSNNVFGFWEWVGGRYSVWSAVGALPLSIAFGYEVFERFLEGGRAIDKTIIVDNYNKDNVPLPVLLGLIGFWNTFICGKDTRVILPYSQALCKFPNHIQQLDMESNGKSVSITTNDFLDYDCGPVVFGEPGTNGQHSFYQLIHQGRKLACEFIAHAKAQQDVKYEGEVVSSHEELMCNFFAQPDALAFGKFRDELNVAPELINHMTFKGDRTSISILFEKLDAYAVGQLLSIYEHRVACEGFLYDINSFDQWGVELGKKLATDVRKVLADETLHEDNKLDEKFNSSTSNLIKFFIKNK